MAKLSEEVLAQGRAFVEAKDLDGFKAWAERYAYTVTWAELEKTFTPLFKCDQMGIALKLFDKFFPALDNAVYLRKGLVRLGCMIFIGLGALGGVVYLISAVFW